MTIVVQCTATLSMYALHALTDSKGSTNVFRGVGLFSLGSPRRSIPTSLVTQTLTVEVT